MLITQDRYGNRLECVKDERYEKDMRVLSTNLRVEDFDEVFAVTGESPHLSVFDVWRTSIKRWIVFDRNGCAVVAAGIVPSKEHQGLGFPWLVGTDGVNTMKKFFLRSCTIMVTEMLNLFGFIANYVDARYKKSVKWLKWCGFTICEPEPFGVSGLPFHLFYMEAE